MSAGRVEMRSPEFGGRIYETSRNLHSPDSTGRGALISADERE